jgi:(4S)-4-hydroxy-5-phosphonooxypentane-2,3-dione isomerase
MYGILFKVTVESAKRADFINFIKWDIEVATTQEPGTLRFDMYQDPKDENTFFVYEAYRDRCAFEDHKQHEPYRRWKPDVEDRMFARYPEPPFKKKFEQLFEGDAVCALVNNQQVNDAARAFRLKDYELKVGYLTGQFTRMWQRFQFFVALQIALVGGKTLFGDKATIPLALVGAVISAAWFIIGSEDRYLVRAYRDQLNAAGNASAGSVLSEAGARSYEPVGQVGTRSKELEEKLAQRSLAERMTEWRCEPISVTRLPAWLALLALFGWLAVLVAQLATQ